MPWCSSCQLRTLATMSLSRYFGGMPDVLRSSKLGYRYTTGKEKECMSQTLSYAWHDSVPEVPSCLQGRCRDLRLAGPRQLYATFSRTFCDNHHPTLNANMAAPSDKARFFLEQSAEELNELERKQIFSRVSNSSAALYLVLTMARKRSAQ